MSLVANAAFNSLTLGPNLYAMTLSRINKHTLGQALSYFDDDFAGRIAQKSQQTARAITDVVLETTNIFGNAVAAAASAAVMLAFIDLRLGILVAIWCAAYAVLLRYFIPRIRMRSKERAARRAVVTGQIVDTITNIVTVKLFAQGATEDQATRKALTDYRTAGVEWAGVVVVFRAAIFTLAGLLPAVLIGASLVALGAGHGKRGRHRRRRSGLDPAGHNDRLGQFRSPWDLFQHRRDRGRHPHPHPVPYHHRRQGGQDAARRAGQDRL